MKLGFLTAPFPETTLMEVADWAAEADFETLEIACWPAGAGADRRYGGTSHIDVANLSEMGARDISGELASKGLCVSGLGYYPNPLHPDPAHRERVISHLKKVIVAARRMSVPFVTTFIGADSAKTPDQNWEDALRIWPDIVSFARDNGVKLAIEHCPMIFSYDEWPSGHNLAYSPKMWRRIIEQWGGTVGINFDPSHFIWEMIDTKRFIGEFGPHIFFFQAQDLQIDRDGLYENGIMSAGMDWQIRRLPGLGEVDWRMVFGELYRAGYAGDCVIEHEDRGFEGSDELLKRGFRLARDFLRPYVK